MPDSFRKVLKDKPFTVLDNKALRDPRLSLKARGLLCTCMSLPPDWNFSIRGLASVCKEGREAVANALTELERAGYLRRNRIQERGEDGTFGGTEYVFFEEAQQPEGESPHPWPGNPATDEPDTDNPSPENPPQQNKEKQNKEKIIPLKPPRGRAAAKKAPDHLPEEFDRLWRAYPRGEDKQGAIAEWDRLRPDEATVFAMRSALLTQLMSEEWRRGIGIPYFVRWLRHRRWEDEKLRSPAGPEAAPERFDSPEVAQW